MRPISPRLKAAKDEIISMIEDDARNGMAFGVDVMEVLYRIPEADLFILQKAFTQSYEIGKKEGSE